MIDAIAVQQKEIYKELKAHHQKMQKQSIIRYLGLPLLVFLLIIGIIIITNYIFKDSPSLTWVFWLVVYTLTTASLMIIYYIKIYPMSQKDKATLQKIADYLANEVLTEEAKQNLITIFETADANLASPKLIDLTLNWIKQIEPVSPEIKQKVDHFQSQLLENRKELETEQDILARTAIQRTKVSGQQTAIKKKLTEYQSFEQTLTQTTELLRKQESQFELIGGLDRFNFLQKQGQSFENELQTKLTQTKQQQQEQEETKQKNESLTKSIRQKQQKRKNELITLAKKIKNTTATNDLKTQKQKDQLDQLQIKSDASTIYAQKLSFEFQKAETQELKEKRAIDLQTEKKYKEELVAEIKNTTASLTKQEQQSKTTQQLGKAQLEKARHNDLIQTEQENQAIEKYETVVVDLAHELQVTKANIAAQMHQLAETKKQNSENLAPFIKHQADINTSLQEISKITEKVAKVPGLKTNLAQLETSVRKYERIIKQVEVAIGEKTVKIEQLLQKIKTTRGW
ncbi:MAG: hypothetical protein ACRC6X_03435 [Culicoidibacterales bacterium]